ncbi:MAG TPA: DUF2652 domain-containing protein [Acidimicrobiia bacterium]
MAAHTGFLLIADITGYTIYLGRSELEHARDTISALLETVISGTRPPLVISKLEGDAVLSYGLEASFLGGQTLMEMIEDCYVGFRNAIELMVLNNTCRCNACANLDSLDLKFFLHHGEFVIQQVGDRAELFGSDVILAHRLLKNDVREATGIAAYTLYTHKAVERIGVALTEEMSRHTLTYEDIGTIAVRVQDMHPVWQARRGQATAALAPDEIVVEVATDVALSPETVWDYLADPEFRNVLMGSDRQEVLDRKQGRITEGSAFQCFHGDRVVPQVILEWRPFERVVTRDLLPVPAGASYLVSVCELHPIEGGTRLVQQAGWLTGPWIGRTISRIFLRASRKSSQRDIDAFGSRIESDALSRGVKAEA